MNSTWFRLGERKAFYHQIIMDLPSFVYNTFLYGLSPGHIVSCFCLSILTILVKDGDEQNFDSNKDFRNGDEDLVIDIDGEETRAMVGYFDAYKWASNSSILAHVRQSKMSVGNLQKFPLHWCVNFFFNYYMCYLYMLVNHDISIQVSFSVCNQSLLYSS